MSAKRARRKRKEEEKKKWWKANCLNTFFFLLSLLFLFPILSKRQMRLVERLLCEEICCNFVIVFVFLCILLRHNHVVVVFSMLVGFYL